MTEYLRDNWRTFFDQELVKSTRIRIISPFVGKTTIDWLLKKYASKNISLITRFNLNDFYEGVSQLDAIEALVKTGAYIRGIQGLHSKLYIFDDRTAIITSANFTEGGLVNNFEFGVTIEDVDGINNCVCYFDSLWSAGKHNVSLGEIESWKDEIKKKQQQYPNQKKHDSLADMGAKANRHKVKSAIGSNNTASNITKCYVKFIGSSNNRDTWNSQIVDIIKESGCNNTLHWPKGKRPNIISDNDIIYIARMTKEPNDYAIFGKAIAHAHDKTRDNVTDEDTKLYSWKKIWPHYIRVSNAVFIKGRLDNCLSLKNLMETFGSNSFASTLKNSQNNNGKNVDPRKSLRQQPGVVLSPDAAQWLNDHFNTAIEKQGSLEVEK
ncbi:MAG: phospholipase D family protein [Elusimicrobia bacterium]|nr:phospholipase D family protein [Elusimicrobiota bacterium]